MADNKKPNPIEEQPEPPTAAEIAEQLAQAKGYPQSRLEGQKKPPSTEFREKNWGPG